MINGNLETRISALEAQMQEIRDLLQRTAQLQVETQQQLKETSYIANSNARSIQAWESLIEQNYEEAEEERSRLAVRLMELEQASRENIAQHFDFRERFDQVMDEIRGLQQGNNGSD